MKKTAFIVAFFCLIMFSGMNVYGQNRKPLFLGIQPAVTAEQFYEKGDFDVNIVPVVFQIPVTKRVDFRITTVLNHHFGSSKEISDIGFQSLAPVFFRKKEMTNVPSHGVYLGPLFGFGRNLMNEHYTYTLGAEPGYMFPTKKRFTLTLGAQFGASYFDYDFLDNKWRNHFGFKINLGFWLNRETNK